MKQLLNQVFNWRKYLQRLILSLALIILATQLVAFPANATGVYQMPQLSAGDRTWIIDQADVLSLVNKGKISSALEKLAQETGKGEVCYYSPPRLW
jgi:uncharacterized protein